LGIARITTEEADKLDSRYRTKMPPGWKLEDRNIKARFSETEADTGIVLVPVDRTTV
jgi:hypothetical protein